MRTVMRSAVPDVPGDVSRDGQLVTLARQGDEQAVRVLVRRYNQQLFRVARGVVHDDGEAEDIVQAAYVRAFTSLDGYRGEASFSTWLTRIALNEAYGRLRRRRPTVELSAVDATDGSGGGDRKSTRLNSSLMRISYAVFCLKKKNKYTLHKPA